MGFKAPRGFGWFTNPKRAAYNRVYNRTTVKADGLIILAVVLVFTFLGAIIKGIIIQLLIKNGQNVPNIQFGNI